MGDLPSGKSACGRAWLPQDRDNQDGLLLFEHGVKKGAHPDIPPFFLLIDSSCEQSRENLTVVDKRRLMW